MNRGLTCSNQTHKDCDGRKEYRNVFDDLQKNKNDHKLSPETPRDMLTIARRCFLTLMLKMGAWICFDGRSQTGSSELNSAWPHNRTWGYLQSKIECRRSTYGTSSAGVSMIKRKWPMRKSELHRESSMILTMNSRAGCDNACEPRPRPYHLPVHHARLVSSCLNSRERNTEIRTLWIARWIATIVMRPSTACDVFQSSRNHYVGSG